MKIKALAISLLLLLASANASALVMYQFVGQWNLGDGPRWTDNPPVYTGQEAAALLFGGNASDYAISTVSDQAADINFSTWLDGWGDSNTYADNGTPAAHDFKVDLGAPGYNTCSADGITCTASAYSAYVDDHFTGNEGLTNFAFRILDTDVPEPASLALLGLGLIGMGRARRK